MFMFLIDNLVSESLLASMLMIIGAAVGPISFPDMFNIFKVVFIIMPLHRYCNPSLPILC